MDYELKCVITIFLLVKIAALSPEFSISEEKENPEQSHGLEAPLGASLSGEERPGPFAGGPYPANHFNRGPGDDSDEMRVESVKPFAESKKIKENPSFDTCEHKIELLESSLKWRNIQKTLRWLDRVLSSNHSSVLERCGKRKTHERRSSPHAKNKNYDFYQSKTGKFKGFFKRKKPKREKKLTGNARSRISSGRETKLKRKRIYKHGFWRNRPKNGREELNGGWKGPGYERNYFPESDSPRMNATIDTKPNGGLFDVERVFFKRAKNRNVKSRGCPNTNSDFDASAGKGDCAGSTRAKVSRGPERDSSRSNEGRSRGTGPRTGDPGSEMPKQKAKAWPHFVYHRVSSNFFHPEPAGHSHRQSAYVAISVATSSKPESTDNNIG